MKVYIIEQCYGWDEIIITGVFTDKKQAKKYARKSFRDYGGWGNSVEEYEVNKYIENEYKRKE